MSKTVITHDGRTMGATEWAREHKVPPHALLRFLRDGLPMEAAVVAARAASLNTAGRPALLDGPQLDKAEKLRALGLPLRVVARRLGVSISTVSRQLAARGGGVALRAKSRAR